MNVCLVPPLLTMHLVGDADGAHRAHLFVNVPQVAIWQDHLAAAGQYGL